MLRALSCVQVEKWEIRLKDLEKAGSIAVQFSITQLSWWLLKIFKTFGHDEDANGLYMHECTKVICSAFGICNKIFSIWWLLRHVILNTQTLGCFPIIIWEHTSIEFYIFEVVLLLVGVIFLWALLTIIEFLPQRREDIWLLVLYEALSPEPVKSTVRTWRQKHFWIYISFAHDLGWVFVYLFYEHP